MKKKKIPKKQSTDKISTKKKTFQFLIAKMAAFQELKLKKKKLFASIRSQKYLWYGDETRQNDGYYQVHPKHPSKKGEVGGDGRSKMRFYFFYTKFPRYKKSHCVSKLPF